MFRAAELAKENNGREVWVWHLATAALDAHNDAFIDATRISPEVLKDQDAWKLLAPIQNSPRKKPVALTSQAKKAVDVACLEARHVEPSKIRRLGWFLGLGPRVNTTCLLIGCLTVDEAIAAYFRDRGVTIDALRQELSKHVLDGEA